MKITGYHTAERTPTVTPSSSLELDCGTSYQSTSQSVLQTPESFRDGLAGLQFKH
ncbi:hypothetical protein DPMN_035475 [Dreissena polymorpha]|uniref:Uncharacterized protein n=1 Tax=Dreissena polymorpha TaxID=45954 RepID=A0A9D4M9M5_DREPO|nr:hypothetical protein DPMN_035475 [Dreissena polymorpha]